MRILIALFLVSGSLSAQKGDLYSKKGLAIAGYDVVSYFSGEAKKGDASFKVAHQGVIFLFASKENSIAFRSDPEKYLPEYGGYCAYAVATKGKKVKIDPETFEVRDGKLYLFYNAWGTNTLTLWQNEDPEKLIPLADSNWKGLDR